MADRGADRVAALGPRVTGPAEGRAHRQWPPGAGLAGAEERTVGGRWASHRWAREGGGRHGREGLVTTEDGWTGAHRGQGWRAGGAQSSTTGGV
jgi:hypothetical protein